LHFGLRRSNSLNFVEDAPDFAEYRSEPCINARLNFNLRELLSVTVVMRYRN
jgi:hypothetical protein